MSYLYYWYDAESLDDPSLALHPPPGEPFDWRDPSWHRQQLADMGRAGIDVALAVYWGDRPDWSANGLTAMVKARQSLLAVGQQPPAIGLFLDTNLYASYELDDPDTPLTDLTDGDSLDFLADQIAGFFDRVPPCHRAQIDGRPLVFLWRPDVEGGTPLNFDQHTFERLYTRLEHRLGVRPYIVREHTWDVDAQDRGITLKTDDDYSWGAAVQGPLFEGRTVSIGPGYDDHLITDRTGYFRDRADGTAYADDLRVAATSGTRWLLLETWNELWEATAIAATAEYGRAYLELTRRHTRAFHLLAGERARDGWFDLGSGESNYLDRLAYAWQELGTRQTAAGRTGARPFMVEGDDTAYFHFALRPRLSPGGNVPLNVQVEYFDDGRGSFHLEYESGAAGPRGTYAPTAPVRLAGTHRWRWQTFNLIDTSFQRRQYDGYGDFRIADLPPAGEPSHLFGRVIVQRLPGGRPVLFEPDDLATVEPTPTEPLELRWRGLTRATGYGIELGSLDGTDRIWYWYGCIDPERWPGAPPDCPPGLLPDGADQRYVVPGLDAALPGQYRWRVWALDVRGAPVGAPSDWGFFQITR
jgi:hypothetical protein